jgi:hypothetical protein
MPVPPSSVLYYPTIDIQNEEWLRTACLFWDSIRTIMPEGFRTPYSKRFAQELHDQGILCPIAVHSDMEEVEILVDDVLDYLTDPSSAGVLFETNNRNTAWLHPDKLPSEIRRIAEIHPSKLPYFIREFLDRSVTERGFLRVDQGFAAFYMTLLARQLADRLGLGLVTDSGVADHLAIAVRKGKALRESDMESRGRRYGRYYEVDGPRIGLPREIASGIILDLMVSGIKLPRSVTAQELIHFRLSHAEELAALRREVMRLVAELPDGRSVEAFRQAIHDQYESEVRPAIKSLRSSLNVQGWNAVSSGFLKASFMSVAPTSALALLHVPTPVAVLAGAGISLTATAATLISQRRDVREDNPYSYLLSIHGKW